MQNQKRKALKIFDAQTIRDYLIAISLILIAIISTLATMPAVGLTWDEPDANFYNSLRQVQWLKLAVKEICSGHFRHPFQKEVVEAYWSGNYHPTLARTLSGITFQLFHRFVGDIVAFRLASSLMFAWLVGSLYWFLNKTYSWKEGLFAATAYLLMPRVFGHAHIAALDTAIAFMWFVTAIAFWRGITHPRWAILTGVIYGAALATKIHALFIPLPVFLWGLLIYGKRKCLNNLLAMLIIAPLVAFLLQPWLWYDSFSKIGGKFYNYTHRAVANPVPVSYFGKVSHFSPPWHYSFVLALVTVPPGIVLSYLWGLIHLRRHRSIILLLTANAATCLSLPLLPRAPGYDGVRLFLPAFPFLAGLAGIGFGQCLDLLQTKVRFRQKPVHQRVTHWILTCFLFLLLLGSSIFSLIDAHPYYISYFNVFIGGVSGAHRLGMETTYWGDAVNQSVLDYLNTYTEEDASIAFLAYNPQIAEYYRKKNLLRREIKPPREADYWILNVRQGKFSSYHWILYEQVQPFYQFSNKGVPMVLVYKSNEVPANLESSQNTYYGKQDSP